MPLILIILLVVILGLAVLTAILTGRTAIAAPDDDVADNPDATHPDVTGYVKMPYIFTSAEFAFYKALHPAVGERFTILAKMRIADLVDVERGTPKRQAKLNRIMKKHVDFVLCDPHTMVPMLLIELDDRSHEADDRRERDALVDAIYTAVGLPCLHVPVAKTYDAADLLGRITSAARR